MQGLGWWRARVLMAAAVLLLASACASDGRPADHAEFAEKWINAVSHIDGEDLNCRIAKDWYAPGRVQDSCQELFDYAQETYLNTQHFFRQEGGKSDVPSLKGVNFECHVDSKAGTAQDLESSGLKLPVTCLDNDGLGFNVLLDRFTGPPANYVIYQIEGDTKFWN